jgi:hypothetical protein
MKEGNTNNFMPTFAEMEENEIYPRLKYTQRCYKKTFRIFLKISMHKD